MGRDETALVELFGTSFNKLDKSKPVEEQVKEFMDEIGMPTTEKLVVQSFIIACNIRGIKYENVLFKLNTLNSNIQPDIIEANLKKTFKIWLKNNPTLAEKCPRMSFMSLLRVFAKTFS